MRSQNSNKHRTIAYCMCYTRCQAARLEGLSHFPSLPCYVSRSSAAFSFFHSPPSQDIEPISPQQQKQLTH